MVALALADTRNECLACEILELVNQHKIPTILHEIYHLLRDLVISPVHLSGDEGINDEQPWKHVHLLVKCTKDLHGFSCGSPSSEVRLECVCVMQTIVNGVDADLKDVVGDLFV